MASSKVEIKAIKVNELHRFACRTIETAHDDEILPINEARALAQVNNPAANDDDVGLLVAYLEGRCIGYLGIMPGYLDTGDALEKVHWLTTFFVSPEHRQTRAGGVLLMEAATLDYDLIGTGLSDRAEQLYRAMRAKPFGPLKYTVLRIDRLNLLGLPFMGLRRWCWSRGWRISALDRIISFTKRLVYPTTRRLVLRALLRRLAAIDPLVVKEKTAVYPESFPRVANLERRPRFHRGGEIVDWMIKYPWPEPIGSPVASRYFFSAQHESFRYTVVDVAGELESDWRANVVFSTGTSNGTREVKTLDFHRGSDEWRSIFVAGVWCALREEADAIVLPEGCENLARSIWVTGLTTERRERIYYCIPRRRDSLIRPLLDDVVLQYPDGDMGFT
jgi:GNAT superfamily N-acetyltransferase